MGKWGGQKDRGDSKREANFPTYYQNDYSNFLSVFLLYLFTHLPTHRPIHLSLCVKTRVSQVRNTRRAVIK